MYNGEKENMQKCLDHLCMAIMETRANGSEKYNHIQELRLINRRGCKNQLGELLPDGMYVRPIWSDHPDRNDGYYDINVNGDSAWAMIKDVVEALSHTL